MVRLRLMLLVALVGVLAGGVALFASGSGESATTTGPREAYLYKSWGQGSAEAAQMPDDQRVHDYIMDACGVDLHMIVPPAGSDAANVLNVMLASDKEQLDMFSVGALQLGQHSRLGSIKPLNELLDKYPAAKKKYSASSWASSTDKQGKIWGIPEDYLAKFMGQLQIRQDWLDKLGLKAPTTISELETVLTRFKTGDLDGNKTDDTVPITFIWNWWSINHSMAAGFISDGFVGGKHVRGADGKLIPYYLDPGYRDFIALLQRWYKAGLINQDEFTTTTGKQQELAQQNRLGLMAGYHSFTYSVNAFLFSNFGERAVFVPITKMTGPKGTLFSDIASETTWFVVPTKSKNTDALFTFLSWYLGEHKNFLTTRYGIPDVHWKYGPKGEFVSLQGEPRNKYDQLWSYMTSGEDSKIEFQLFAKSGNKAERFYWFGERAELFFNAPGIELKRAPDLDMQYDMGAIGKEVKLGDLNTYVTENLTKFVTGVQPMEQWDAFTKGLKALDIDKYVELVNAQFASR